MTPVQVYPASREDWLGWRKQGLGSSDAATILGASPWKTARELWLEKTGRMPEQTEPSYVQRLGIEAEPRARAHYELLRGAIDMPPTCFEHPDHRYLRASLDGYHRESGRILEIKLVGRESFADAQAGKIPEHYQWQMIHQMLVSGGKSVDFYAYRDGAGALVEFARNPAMEFRLFEAERAFWGLVQSDTPPPLTDRDWLDLKDPAAVELFEAWRLLKTAEIQTPEQKKRMEEMREEMRRFLIHPRVQAGGVRMSRVKRQGGDTIDVRLKPVREEAG